MSDEQLSMYDGIVTTRAIRRYRYDKPIPPEDLNKMFFAATRAPSGNNSQPFRFMVLRDGPRAREARALLGVAFRARWGKKGSDEGYGSAAARTLSPKERLAAAMQEFVDNVERAPVVVLPCIMPSTSSGSALLPATELARGASVYPACQNLLLAARSLGYGGAMTMWHKPAGVLLPAVLGIPEDVEIAATIVIGAPAGHHGPVRRRPVGELVFEDGWGEAPAWARDPDGTRFAGPRPKVPQKAPEPAAASAGAGNGQAAAPAGA
jgi:nitroreductase